MNMKKNGILAAVLILVLLFGLLFRPAPVMAVSDALDLFAWEYLQAVESKSSQQTITTTITDLNVLLEQLFTRYPALYHYYDGCSSMSYPGEMEVTMQFKNLATDVHSLYIVDSDEDLLAILGLCLGEIRDNIQFIAVNGYIPDENIEASLTQLQYNYHLAYMGYHGWSTNYTYSDEWGIRDYTLGITYFYELDAATLQQWRNETEQVALQLASSLFARQDMPGYLKVLRIHDWLVNNARYNISNMDEPGNHLAYGALVKGSCVCMGYAEACTLLFQAAGIESVSVSGFGTNSEGHRESHAWNAIQLDGDWYMLDTTWDDPVTSDGSDILRYDYFNVTSAQLAKDHEWEYDKYPQCNGTFYNIEKVQELVSQDQGVYSGFDPGALMTQEKALAEFRAVLAQTQPVLPIQSQPAPTQPAPAQPSQPTNPAQPTIVPQPTDPAPTQSVVVPQPGDAGSEGDSSIVVWIIVGILVVLGGGATALVLARKKQQQPKTTTRYDTSSGSGFSDLPKRW